MLHTLNKPWLKIIVNQSINDTAKQFLIVTSDNGERFDAIDDLWSILPHDFETAHIFVITINDLKFQMVSCAYYHEEFPMYDDILISHTVQDIFVKSFLGQHCKRKWC